MAATTKNTRKNATAKNTKNSRTLLQASCGIADDKAVRDAVKNDAKKAAAKKNAKNSKTKNAVKKAEPTKTITIKGKKIKVSEKRSSRFNVKGVRVQKKCSVCGKWQPIDLYSRPERDCRCKECNSSYAAELKERNGKKNSKNKTAAKKNTRKTAAKNTSKNTKRNAKK